MDDKSKWYLFLQGDKTALSEIFLNHYDDLYNYGFKLFGNADIVEDSIQDLFLKLWKNRKKLQSIHAIKPYLFKSLRNQILDNLELIKPWKSIENDDETMFQVIYSHEDFMVDNQIKEEISLRVITTLNKLSGRQREAIYLRYFENLEFETIGQIMNMNIQSVRNNIHRAMKLMRDMMLLPVFFIIAGLTLSNL